LCGDGAGAAVAVFHGEDVVTVFHDDVVVTVFHGDVVVTVFHGEVVVALVAQTFDVCGGVTGVPAGSRSSAQTILDSEAVDDLFFLAAMAAMMAAFAASKAFVMMMAMIILLVLDFDAKATMCFL
jgi:hypothetical protein